jgi:hypothetical protein
LLPPKDSASTPAGVVSAAALIVAAVLADA